MEAVFEMNGLRVVDLSKSLDPATETRRCKLRRFNTGGPIPDFHTDMDLLIFVTISLTAAPFFAVITPMERG